MFNLSPVARAPIDMSISLQAAFVAADGTPVLSCSATGSPGKQQEFNINTPVVDIPGNVRAVLRTSDGKQASTARLITEEDDKKDKCWAKLGKLGDALIVQILLKKQSAGTWRLKKIVVTCDQSRAQPVVSRPPRITCSDEEAGDDLLGCARYGELDDLKSILEADIPVDYQNEGYNTALHYASANGHAECVEYLLSKGARHLPNSSGNTPLHWAVQNKHISVVKILLERAQGVDVLQKNDFGKSVLTEAFGLESADITQLLLEHTSASGLDAPAQNGVVEEETDEVADQEGANETEGNAQADGMQVEGARGDAEQMETDS